MDKKGKFTPKTPTNNPRYRTHYIWPERRPQIIPELIAAAQSAGGKSQSKATSNKKSGTLGSNIISDSSGTSGAGMPSSASIEGPQSSKGCKRPRNIQSFHGQKKDGEETPTRRRNSSAESLALPVYQSMAEKLKQLGTDLTPHAGSSTGSAGPPTPRVKPGTLTNNRENGPLGTSIKHLASLGGSSTGSAGPSTSQVKPGTLTNNRQNGPLGTSIPVVAVPGTLGAGIPSSANAVDPQSSIGHKRPPIKQSFQDQKKYEDETPKRRRKSCAEPSALLGGRSVSESTRGNDVANYRKLTRPLAQLPSVDLLPVRQRPPHGLFTPTLQIPVVAVPGTLGAGIPSSANAVDPQSSIRHKRPPIKQSFQDQKKYEDETPKRRRKSCSEPSALLGGRSVSESTRGNDVANIGPGTFGTSGTDMSSGVSAEDPQRSRGCQRRLSKESDQDPKKNGKKTPPRERNSSTDRSVSKSTRKDIVIDLTSPAGTSTGSAGPPTSQVKPGTLTNNRENGLLGTSDKSNGDQLLDLQIQINEQIKKVGQNTPDLSKIIEKSEVFFKMLEIITNNLLKVENNILKQLLGDNHDIYNKVDLMTTKFESLLNFDANTTAELNKTETEREVPRNANYFVDEQGVVVLDDSGSTPK